MGKAFDKYMANLTPEARLIYLMDMLMNHGADMIWQDIEKLGYSDNITNETLLALVDHYGQG